MSCDGTIYNMGGYPRIEFAVASEKLAQDVHHALTRFGIVAKLWQKTPRCWRVEITEPAFRHHLPDGDRLDRRESSPLRQ